MSPKSFDSDATHLSKQKKKKDITSQTISSTTHQQQQARSSSPASAPSESNLGSSPSLSSSAFSSHQLRAALPSARSASSAESVRLQYASAQPRTFAPSPIRQGSAIDTVTATLTSLSHQANRGISSLLAASHASSPNAVPALASPASVSANVDGTVSPIYDAFENTGSEITQTNLDRAVNRHVLSSAASQRVVWSRWDQLIHKEPRLGAVPVLITYYSDDTLQLLLVEHEQISEILCLPSAASAVQNLAGSASPAGQARISAVAVRASGPGHTDPQLLLTLTESSRSTRLVSYSLTSHQTLASIELQHSSPAVLDDGASAPSQACHIECNDRFVALSFASPPSIHVLSASNLEYAHPVITLPHSPAVLQRPPAMSLSNRLLAYAYACPREQLNPIRMGEMRDNLVETSTQVSDAARRLGGGVVSGVRTLGEWGSSYWHANPSSPPANVLSHTPPSSLLSQSAPHASHVSRSVSSASSSPYIAPADQRTGRNVSTAEERTSTKDNASKSVSPSTSVRIVDLGSGAKTLVTFTPSSHHVSAVAFSPCGQLILTADSFGHTFNIFELQVAGAFGASCSSGEDRLPLLHRYRLVRGVTSADVVQAQWSHDSQWLAVGTKSGAVHFYAVNPGGGPPLTSSHSGGKVQNPTSLQPLGVTLNSLARSARLPRLEEPSTSAEPGETRIADQEVATGSLPCNDSASGSAPIKASLPSFAFIGRPIVQQVQGRGGAKEQSVSLSMLVNDPRNASVMLNSFRCYATHTVSADEDTVHSALNQPRSRSSLPKSRSSGISEMMRRAGEGLIASQPGAPRLFAETSRLAAWTDMWPTSAPTQPSSLTAALDSGMTRRQDTAKTGPSSWISKAEIETYSQAPGILPSSVYLSRQAFFHDLRLGDLSDQQQQHSLVLRHMHRAEAEPIKVRETAQIVSSGDSSATMQSYDQSLAGAFDAMDLDPEEIMARSPSARIPSFPQGQAARSSGWASGSIPIRIVAGSLGGVYKAGRGLGRGVEMARRRTSGGGAGGSMSGPPGTSAKEAPTVSVSFDGVDEVDLLYEGDLRGRPGASQPSRSHVSDASLPSAFGHDGRMRGSNPSSAETPLTKFSDTEGRDRGDDFDSDEPDWDALDEVPATQQDTHCKDKISDVQRDAQLSDEAEPLSSMDDDFTVGMLDEDTPIGTRDGSEGDPSPKGLVYALRTGASTRSTLLSQSISNMDEITNKPTRERDSSPSGKSEDHLSNSSNSNLDSSGSNNEASDGSSGQLTDGTKETQTLGPTIPGSLPMPAAALIAPAVAATPISTSNKKKKKKHGR
ncbi:hypothetical protein BCV70DRAFT_161578 [Testicularia cyperi]|uniref:BCAS3 WD40 domain-containing protein n=1 Tax=Testicularia cyperi TaxID=1882483 RepID=A0A317XP61_9BASI|nr:hypothetical protein BCV70DRAFT_161578 [Testicularia cyperi]